MKGGVYREQHAVASPERHLSFSQYWYDTPEKESCISYYGTDILSVFNIVSQTEMISFSPYNLAEKYEKFLGLKILPLPLNINRLTCYLSWDNKSARHQGKEKIAKILKKTCRR